jgi:hypothetical protein
MVLTYNVPMYLISREEEWFWRPSLARFYLVVHARVCRLNARSRLPDERLVVARSRLPDDFFPTAGCCIRCFVILTPLATKIADPNYS